MKRVILCLTLAVFFGVLSSALQAGPEHFHIASVNSSPEGQTYGRWAAEWWQWALGGRASVSPLLDPTGENCAQRQVNDVWFLAGTFGSDPVVRECTVPEGKSLFFPLINSFSGGLLSPPPDFEPTQTGEELREEARCKFPVELFAEIDGFRVSNLLRFFTGATGSQSPLFNVQLHSENFFGVGEPPLHLLVTSPSAEEGYYLFIRPLPPGEHTIRWIATGFGAPDFTQDITYHLTVANDNGD
jgi:hypothetical protein